MLRGSARIRPLYASASFLVIAAVLYRIQLAHLPANVLLTEGQLVIVGIVYGALAIVVRTSRRGESVVVQIGLAACNVLISAVVLGLLARYLTDLPAVAFAVFAVILLVAESGSVQLALVGVGAVAMAALGWVWVGTDAGAGRLGTVAVWDALLKRGWLGIAVSRSPGPDFHIAMRYQNQLGLVFVEASWSSTALAELDHVRRERLLARAKVVHLDATAEAARRLGLATDVHAVALAVLESTLTAYPDTDLGAVLVGDSDGELLSLPMALTPAGIIATDGMPEIRMASGEGLAGRVFRDGAAGYCATEREVADETSSMRPESQTRMLSNLGRARCSIAAPLRLPERGIMGVLTLGSTKRERIWGAEDVIVIQALADQAALALERARLYEERRNQALTDPLTELANLRQLESVMGQEVARAHRYGGKLSVTVLDGFKQVNDTFGHAVGDTALKIFASTLRRVLRTEDTAARYGGDEFVCVLPGADWTRAQLVAERIARLFNEAIQAEPHLQGVETGCSAGAAVYPDDGITPTELLNAADEDLLRLKAKTAADRRSRLQVLRGPADATAASGR